MHRICGAHINSYRSGIFGIASLLFVLYDDISWNNTLDLNRKSSEIGVQR